MVHPSVREREAHLGEQPNDNSDLLNRAQVLLVTDMPHSYLVLQHFRKS